MNTTFFKNSSLDNSGFVVSGLHGKNEGHLVPYVNTTNTGVYKYYLNDTNGKGQCMAGIVSGLDCKAGGNGSGKTTCTGNFHETSFMRNSADPDAKITFIMDKSMNKVQEMAIQHNTSDRKLHQFLVDNSARGSVPSQKMPLNNITPQSGTQNMVNTISVLSYDTSAGPNYQLSHNKNRYNQNVKGYLTNVTCTDNQCIGDIVEVGRTTPPQYEMRLTMQSKAPGTNGGTNQPCRDPLFTQINGVAVKAKTDNAWPAPTCSS